MLFYVQEIRLCDIRQEEVLFLCCHCLHWQRSMWTRTKPDSRVWLRVWIVWQACCWLGPLIPATCRNAFLLRNIQSNTGLEIVYTQCNAGQAKNSENLLYMVVLFFLLQCKCQVQSTSAAFQNRNPPSKQTEHRTHFRRSLSLSPKRPKICSLEIHFFLFRRSLSNYCHLWKRQQWNNT